MKIITLTTLLSLLAVTAIHAESAPGTITLSKPAPTSAHIEMSKSKAEPVTYLGVAIDEISAETAAQLPLDPGTGLIVRSVVADGPGAAAELRENDVLAKIDDQVLVNAKQFQTIIRNRKPGDKIEVTYFRKGEQKTASVVLTQRDPSADKRPSMTFTGQPRTAFNLPAKKMILDKTGNVVTLTSGSDLLEETLKKLEEQLNTIAETVRDAAKDPQLREQAIEKAKEQVKKAQAEVNRRGIPLLKEIEEKLKRGDVLLKETTRDETLLEKDNASDTGNRVN